VTIDVGTGNGRAVIAAAAREPTVLAIGLDADARSMAESSRRAARAASRAGIAANITFVVAAAEAVPAELVGIAALVTVHFPWASLLRGCLGLDEAVAAGVAALPAPDGMLELLLAPATWDRLADLPTEPADVIAAARAAFEARGLSLMEARLATSDEIRASGSSWARRLLGGTGPIDGARGFAEPTRHPVLVRFRKT
jgi:16S rRNA (adenine(1408)-N(1))-methyltransferase